MQGAMASKIEIVIADDHGLIRQGLKRLLQENDHFNVIGEAANGAQTIDLVKELEPDVLITDIFMPELTGIEVAKMLKEQNSTTAVLVISASFDEEHVFQSYQKGAMGYIFKGANEKLIISAVERVARGELFYSQLVMNILAKKHHSKNNLTPLPDELTQRESQILKLLADGVTNKEIAYQLHLSTRTVDAHRRNIMEKLNVNNSAQLIRVGIEKNLI